MIDYEVTDDELARLADWAERMEVATSTSNESDWRKAYGAIRQGADWLLRRRTLKRHRDISSDREPVTVHKQ